MKRVRANEIHENGVKKKSNVFAVGLSRFVPLQKKIEEKVEEVDPEGKTQKIMAYCIDVEFQSDEFKPKVRFTKNHYVTPNSPESCYFVKWINRNKNAKRDLKGSGIFFFFLKEGILVVKYDNCELQDMQGKIVGKATFTREPAKMNVEAGSECNQKIVVKKKSTYFFPGNVVVIGSKAAQV